MLVEIGHRTATHGPAVTYAQLPDEAYAPLSEAPEALTAEQLALHLQRAGLVTHLDGYESFLAIAHPWGVVGAHVTNGVDWVRSDNPDLNALLAEFYGVPGEAPPDLEDTHWTRHGRVGYPPGAAPPPDLTMLLNDGGRDSLDTACFSAGGSATVLGQTGTATATSATSLTGGTESPGGAHVANDAAGQVIVAWSNGAYGIVNSNTSGTSPVYTVDRWYTPGSPGGAAASTPGSTTGYTLMVGAPPMLFMGLSANTSTPLVGDNYPNAAWNLASAMTGEIVTAGGGLIPKIITFAHTAGTNSLTGTAVFTANGSDTLPVTIAKMGIGPSIVGGNRRGLQTLLNATATLNLSGDQLTVTDTITTS